jgi:hypothetical protein
MALLVVRFSPDDVLQGMDELTIKTDISSDVFASSSSAWSGCGGYGYAIFVLIGLSSV